MRKAHNPEIMEIELVRAFLVIAGEGSLNRAAQRLHVAQSTLTRRLQTLEQQVGGTLFERAPSGVALTAAGHVLADAMRPVLCEFDAAVETARRAARGQSARLRIGYLMCVAADYLHPALAALRERHPEVKVRLQDLSPGEQIDALRRGEIELAIFGGAGAPARCDFHSVVCAMCPCWWHCRRDIRSRRGKRCGWPTCGTSPSSGPMSATCPGSTRGCEASRAGRASGRGFFWIPRV